MVALTTMFHRSSISRGSDKQEGWFLHKVLEDQELLGILQNLNKFLTIYFHLFYFYLFNFYSYIYSYQPCRIHRPSSSSQSRDIKD